MIAVSYHLRNHSQLIEYFSIDQSGFNLNILELCAISAKTENGLNTAIFVSLNHQTTIFPLFCMFISFTLYKLFFGKNDSSIDQSIFNLAILFITDCTQLKPKFSRLFQPSIQLCSVSHSINQSLL